jgi:3-hydroxyisobutyrate dehydrogenase
VDPSTARKIAEAAAKTKLAPKARPLPGLSTSTATFLDAPVSGGVVGADAGSLSFMVGGNKAALEVLKPYLQSMGTHVTYCGSSGAGAAARLCNTLVVGASMAAVSEALALGRRLGLQPETLTDVLNNSSGRCWSSERYNPVPGILPDVPSSKGYKGGLPTDFVHQQLEMLITAAEAAHSPVPVAKRMKELYEHIHDEGLGDKDFSSIFRYVYGQGCDNMEWKEGQQLFSSQVP